MNRLFPRRGLQVSYLQASWFDHTVATSSLEARANLRHLLSLEKKEYSPSEMRKGGMISLVNAREVISTSGKDIILLVTGRKQLASGKERCSKTDLKRIYFRRLERGAIQTRSYSDAKLSRIANLHDSLANLFQSGSRIESEAELTTMATFIFHIPSIKAIQSISESEPFHYRLLKTLKGVLLTL